MEWTYFCYYRESEGSLRKNLYNCPEQIKTQAYYSLVWPHLEYACSLWDPHTQKNIQSIEKVLHSVARFDNKYNQGTPGTITSLLEELKWPSLEQRRKQTRLTNLYKFVNGNPAVEIPYYCKIPKISPRAYIFQRPFLRGLFLVRLIFGGAYLRREICISKSIGLAWKLEVNLPFLLCFTLCWRAIFQVQAPGGLIFGGAI